MNSLRMGQRLGRYELQGRIGRGGAGEVWEAVLHGPEGFRKVVALKLLLPGPTTDDRRRALVAEARLGALLQHPNVVATHDLGEVDGHWYVAMELVRGATLAELVPTAPLPPAAVLDVGLQACAGLEHVHGLEIDGVPANLVHRDVKPGNLLVERTGLVKLADLGIARLAASGGAVAGTPGFMPDEQAQGREGPRSDLFALGATLYLLVTGQAAFGHGPAAILRVQAVEEKLADPAFLGRAEVAVPGLGEVLRRCLRAAPRDRWPDAGSLREALVALRARLPPGPGLLDVVARVRPDLAVSVPRAVAVPEGPRTVVTSPGNLPAPRDRFVGREGDVAAVTRRVLAAERLLTLHGPGGTGKTRLALAVARECSTELEGGAWFFDLSDATTVEGICHAVGSALSLPLDRTDPVHQLGRVLAYRGRSLVVLDNLEQVVLHLPPTLGRWLELAPEATFLCTSRIACKLRGERRIEVGPLGPAEGVELFVERAVRPPSVAERPMVEALVAELEGLPLAIELAAARTRLMPVARIRERLADRLKLLSDGDRDRPARQQSLRASLDASWELLPDWGRRALAQLAVFEGGFTLDAAEGVLDLPDGAPWGMDVLAELGDASLVRVDPGGERFRMLVAVQEYARSRATDGERAAAEVRHGRFFAQLGSEASRLALGRAGGLERLKGLVWEVDNLVVATDRAIRRGEARVASGACAAAAEVFLIRGPLQEAVQLGERVLALRGLADADRATLHLLVAVALQTEGRLADARVHLDAGLLRARAAGSPRLEAAMLARLSSSLRDEARMSEAHAHAEAALALSRTLPDRALEGSVLRDLAGLLWARGRLAEARTRFEEAAVAHRSVGDRRCEGFALGNVGLVAHGLGDDAAARTLLQAAVVVMREAGDHRNEGIVELNLGLVAQTRGDPTEARAHYARALHLLREVGDRRHEALVLSNVGLVLHRTGHSDEARAAFEDVLVLERELGDRRAEALVLMNLGEIHHDHGRADEASAVWDQALARSREMEDGRLVTHIEAAFGMQALLEGRTAVARERFEAAPAVAEACGDAIRRACAQGYLGRVAFAEGDPAAARQLLEEAVEGLAERDTLVRSEFLTHLAEVYDADGDAVGASGALEQAIATLRAAGFALSLGGALCVRARFHGRHGRAGAAASDLREARAIAGAIALPPEAPLRREIGRTARALGAE